MITIQYDTIKRKDEVVLEAGCLSLCNHTVVLVKGDKDTITMLFKRIHANTHTQWRLEDRQLDKKLLKKQILYLDHRCMFEVDEKVEHVFDSFDEMHRREILEEIGLYEKRKKTIAKLSKEERLLLSFQFACRSQPVLLLIDGDWNQDAGEQLLLLQKIVNTYQEKGGLILSTHRSSTLFETTMMYEIKEKHLRCHSDIVHTYLDESELDIKPKKKKSKLRFYPRQWWKQGLFFLSGVAFLFFFLFAFLGFDETMNNLEERVENNEKRDFFSTKLYFEVSMKNSEQGFSYIQEQLDELAQNPNVFDIVPIHSAYVEHEYSEQSQFQVLHQGKDISTKQKDEAVSYVEMLRIQTYPEEYPNSIDFVKYPTSHKDGVLINQEFMKKYNLSIDDLEDTTIKMNIPFPLFLQEYKYTTSDDGTEINYHPINKNKVVEVDISGVIESYSGAIWMGQSYFERIQKELGMGLPYDRESFYDYATTNIDDSLSVVSYQSLEYAVICDSIEKYNEVKSYLDKTKMDYEGDYGILSTKLLDDAKLAKGSFQSQIYPMALLLGGISLGFALWIGSHQARRYRNIYNLCGDHKTFIRRQIASYGIRCILAFLMIEAMIYVLSDQETFYKILSLLGTGHSLYEIEKPVLVEIIYNFHMISTLLVKSMSFIILLMISLLGIYAIPFVPVGIRYYKIKKQQ